MQRNAERKLPNDVRGAKQVDVELILFQLLLGEQRKKNKWPPGTEINRIHYHAVSGNIAMECTVKKFQISMVMMGKDHCMHSKNQQETKKWQLVG